MSSTFPEFPMTVNRFKRYPKFAVYTSYQDYLNTVADRVTTILSESNDKKITIDKFLLYEKKAKENVKDALPYIHGTKETPIVGLYHSLLLLDGELTKAVKDDGTLEVSNLSNGILRRQELGLLSYLLEDFIVKEKAITAEGNKIEDSTIYRWATGKFVNRPVDTADPVSKYDNLLNETLAVIDALRLNEFAFILKEGIVITHGHVLGNPYNPRINTDKVPYTLARAIEEGVPVEGELDILKGLVPGQIANINGYKFSVTTYHDTSKINTPFEDAAKQEIELYNTPDDIYYIPDEIVGLSDRAGKEKYIKEGNDRFFDGIYSTYDKVGRPYIKRFSDIDLRKKYIKGGATADNAEKGFNVVKSLSRTVKDIQEEVYTIADKLVWDSNAFLNIIHDDNIDFKNLYISLCWADEKLKLSKMPESAETYISGNAVKLDKEVKADDLKESDDIYNNKKVKALYTQEALKEINKTCPEDSIRFKSYDDRVYYDYDPDVRDGDIAFMKDKVFAGGDEIRVHTKNNGTVSLRNSILTKSFFELDKFENYTGNDSTDGKRANLSYWFCRNLANMIRESIDTALRTAVENDSILPLKYIRFTRLRETLGNSIIGYTRVGSIDASSVPYYLRIPDKTILCINDIVSDIYIRKSYDEIEQGLKEVAKDIADGTYKLVSQKILMDVLLKSKDIKDFYSNILAAEQEFGAEELWGSFSKFVTLSIAEEEPEEEPAEESGEEPEEKPKDDPHPTNLNNVGLTFNNAAIFMYCYYDPEYIRDTLVVPEYNPNGRSIYANRLREIRFVSDEDPNLDNTYIKYIYDKLSTEIATLKGSLKWIDKN